MILRGDDKDDGGDNGHSCDSPVESTVWTRSSTAECSALKMDFFLWLKYFPIRFYYLPHKRDTQDCLVFITRTTIRFEFSLSFASCSAGERQWWLSQTFIFFYNQSFQPTSQMTSSLVRLWTLLLGGCWSTNHKYYSWGCLLGQLRSNVDSEGGKSTLRWSCTRRKASTPRLSPQCTCFPPRETSTLVPPVHVNGHGLWVLERSQPSKHPKL